MCSYSSKSQSKTNTCPCCFDWHKYLWCDELHTHTNAFLVGNTVHFTSYVTTKQLNLHVRGALKSSLAYLLRFGMLGFINGKEVVWKISLPVSLRFQHRLVGPLPVSPQRPSRGNCVSLREQGSTPEGQLCWAYQLVSGRMASRGLPSGAWVKIQWETHPNKENVNTSSPYQ